jgi:tetratricopeptide (TPR) repeat protein
MRSTKPLALIVALAAVVFVTAGGDWADPPPPPLNGDYEAGVDAIKAEDWSRAITHLETAAKAEPGNAETQARLGYAYRQAGKTDLAIRQFNAAIKLDPYFRAAHGYIGEAYVATGDKAKAQEHLATLARLCKSSCDEYHELADTIAKAR